ncbi:C4-dicarboxylate ABC transporter substrate-binding protein [Nocardiopsis gilva YIM 90087]|uniref:C4-dicarboxylate ABC transporter substrate-binding protein n=1 Tax=Nocardiopsis gilva YIM 90087 TaxID=1235441 RepID=A0A223SAE2_9ACTN|nr:C4-dicarboxylate ABC transporter substrate-binding protein [Nocardiopsis gilva YIM 90087]
MTALPLSLILLTSCTQPAERGSFESLSIASGTTGGVYYPIAGAISQIVGSEIEGVGATPEATAASVENLRLLGAGASELAVVQGDSAYQADSGEGEFAEKPVENRALLVLYPNVYHNVSLRSIDDRLDLDCFSDVKGHRFSVGAPGSGNELTTSLVFADLGMDFDDIDVQRYAYAETARALREGQLDAGSWVVGEGHGSLRELEATDPLHLIPLCGDEVDAVVEDHPFYTSHIIEGGTYSTVSDDVRTVAVWNILTVRPEFPDKLAYRMVKAVYENADAVNRVYQPGTEYLVPESLRKSPVPLHPGALRYAEEAGVDIPLKLRG